MMPTAISAPAPYQTAIAGYKGAYKGKRRLTAGITNWTIVSATVADYDTGTFTLPGSPAVTFEWYVNPTPPPVLPIIGIDLTGFVTASGIGNATIAAIRAAGYQVIGIGPVFTVVQKRLGAAGNTEIDVSGIGAGKILINGLDPANFLVLFFGGQDLGIPILWGPQRGMAPTTSNTPRGEITE